MICLESIFDRSCRVCLFKKTITLSARKLGKLNLLRTEPCDAWGTCYKDWLSFDNQSDCLHTGGH